MSYIKLYNLDIYHEYFYDNKGIDLYLKPTVQTDNVLKQFGFTFLQDASALQLFFNNTANLTERLNYITTKTGVSSFDFTLTFHDPNFYFYTDIPLNFNGRYLYKSKNTKKTSTQPTSLSPIQKEEGDFSEFALIQIAFSDLNANKVNHNSITINARKTQWLYYIINRSKLVLDHCTIKENGEISFIFNGEVELQNGEKALSFASKNKNLSLINGQKYNFNLITSSSGTSQFSQQRNKESTIFKGLPYPRPEQLNVKVTDGKQHYSSPIYVYV